MINNSDYLPFDEEDKEMIEREQFRAKITRLRMDGKDEEATHEWLHNSKGLVSFDQFVKIDPRRDLEDFAKRQEANLKRGGYHTK